MIPSGGGAFPWPAWAAGLASSLLLAGPSLVLARRLGLLDRPGGRKAHEGPVPLAGGLPFLGGILAGPALAGSPLSLPLAAAFTGCFLFGLWDDKKEGGLSWKTKLLGQAGAGLLAGWALWGGNPLGLAAFTLWAVLLQNASNFQDNMNGLAVGAGGILCASAALLSQGPAWAPPLGGAAAGALLALLPFNFPKARLFLGDQASLLAGLLLAVLTGAPGRGGTPVDPALLLVPALPLLDMGATLLYRARRGMPLHQADRNHLSHRLSRAGLGPRKAVLLLWTLTALLGAGLPLLVRLLRSR